MPKTEFKIGETFQCGLVKLKCEIKRDSCCGGCFFNSPMYECENNEYFIGSCLSKRRNDNTDVIFVKVEDIEE